MRLLPDPDALEFAGAVRDLLAEACDTDALRAAWDGDEGASEDDVRRCGRIPGLWKRLADVGVTGLTVPEEHGGSGMDLTAAVPVLVEAGRAALPEPLGPTLAGTAVLVAGGGEAATRWLPLVVAGEAAVALGEGPEPLVVGGQWAELFLLADDRGVHAVPRAAVEVTPAAALDHGIGLATVRWQPPAGDALPATAGQHGFDVACVAVAAELTGLAQAMLDMAVRYARQREQFGKPIGSFQAVKHLLADVYVANSFALPVVHRAAWSVAHALPSAGRDASHAVLAARQAARLAARTALQVHAGIGYTYEHDLHIWMKRTWSLAAAWGDDRVHRRRVAAAVLGDAPPPRVP